MKEKRDIGTAQSNQNKKTWNFALIKANKPVCLSEPGQYHGYPFIYIHTHTQVLRSL